MLMRLSKMAGDDNAAAAALEANHVEFFHCSTVVPPLCLTILIGGARAAAAVVCGSS